MTLEDFGEGDDDEEMGEMTRKVLLSSKSERHRNLVSDDPAVRLQAYKDSLASICEIIDDGPA